jgi:hypothetical protein
VLRSSVPNGSSATSPVGNITGEVTMRELLANDQLVPGMNGAYLKVSKGEAIRFGDLSQLTINHNGAEFMLSREIVRDGKHVTRRWRIYSGTPDQIPAPRFFDPHAPGGGTVVERIVGHTHTRPMPYNPNFMQPSGHDVLYLTNNTSQWKQVYGPQSEPFGRVIWGLDPGETTIYGINSTANNAVLPFWLRRP